MSVEQIAKIAQACFGSSPVVVLGSGASAPHGLPGMGALKDFLLEKVIPANDEETNGWAKVVEAFSVGEHLEQALAGKALPANLTRQIVNHTWGCINTADQALFLRAVGAQHNFGLGRLIVAQFASSQKTLDIVTTNYDRVAEYACNSVDIIHSVGFTPGYLQRREGSLPISLFQAGKAVRTVRIWKVHGSLDWFERLDGSVIAAPLFQLPSTGLIPLIVTPGFNKYERTHDEPFRSTIQGADRALEQAEGYLCVGFGFRDAHIEPKILDRCRNKNVPVTVIARTLTDEAKQFLQQKAGPHFLGIEQNGSGSRAYFHAEPNGCDIPDTDFWSIEGFLKLVT